MRRDQILLLDSTFSEFSVHRSTGSGLANNPRQTSARRSAPPADLYRLDDRTRQIGRAGVAAAREALRQAARHAA